MHKPGRLPLRGAHGIARRALEIQKDVVRDSMQAPFNVEHRLELVRDYEGVRWVNDSRATNVNSTWYALEAINAPIIWLAGGVDNGNFYLELKPLVERKVKALYVISDDVKKFIACFSDVLPIILPTASMHEAVIAAHILTEPGDTVLLSPACASFDRYENYVDRGHVFKAAVNRL